MGLSVGLGSLWLAGCDSSSEEGDTSSAAASTTGGGGMLTGTPIPFSNGWVPFAENPFLIQGAFYTFKDNPEDADGDTIIGTSLITPESFADSGAQICATGTAGKVDGKNTDGSDAYDDFWGAAIGLNLKQEEGMDAALAFDAAAAGLTGFSFMIEGASPIPAGGELRFNIKVAGDSNNYCKKITAAGANTFKLSEMYQSCWMNDTTLPTPDATKLEAIHWQYVTNTSASYDFDICITALAGTTD
ncbi:MAG TPA: hypothetical protein VI197_02590 [Polyangiaceae bacterium]